MVGDVGRKRRKHSLRQGNRQLSRDEAPGADAFHRLSKQMRSSSSSSLPLPGSGGAGSQAGCAAGTLR